MYVSTFFCQDSTRDQSVVHCIHYVHHTLFPLSRRTRENGSVIKLKWNDDCQRGVTLRSTGPDILYTLRVAWNLSLSIRFQECFALACYIVRVKVFFSVTKCCVICGNIHWSVTLVKRSFHSLILFPVPLSGSALFSSSTALVRTDQYLRWLCKVEFTRCMFLMVLMLSLAGLIIATSQGSPKLSSTARRLLRAVYWTSMWWPHRKIVKAVLR